jgi:two-component SAPR family response regulator
MLMEEILLDVGITPVCFVRFESAKDFLKSHEPLVMIVDSVVANEHFRDFIIYVRNNYGKSINIVLFAGYGASWTVGFKNDPDINEHFEYIPKPTSQRITYECLEKVLGLPANFF